MDIYKPKMQQIEAEQLECDVEVSPENGKRFKVLGGNYLIKGSDDQIYPVNKRIFEFLFEREEQK